MTDSSAARTAPSAGWTAAVFSVLIVAAYWFVLSGLVHQWFDDPNYTHGLFVLPLAGLLAWRRRDRLATIPAGTSRAGVVFLFLSAVVYVVGIAAAELFLMRISLVGTVVGLVWATQGTARTRVLAWPLLFLLLMIPLPYLVYYRLTFPLQLQSSAITGTILSWAGMPVLREGNVLRLEGYSLEVVTACSGLRSIMTLGAMALFLVEFMNLGRWGRGLFLLLVIPVAVAANSVRLLMTAVLSAVSGPEAAEGFLHGMSGTAVFLLGLATLIVIGKAIEWLSTRRA
jgi:exosortase